MIFWKDECAKWKAESSKELKNSLEFIFCKYCNTHFMAFFTIDGIITTKSGRTLSCFQMDCAFVFGCNCPGGGNFYSLYKANIVVDLGNMRVEDLISIGRENINLE